VVKSKTFWLKLWSKQR